ncbi:MAG: low molecular weight phosphotyrosine protein phosphatase [Xanthomonadales bacterium]|nr:low molecular weight phosphotyrosine protein phosphatase [Xanthomonadales bacterium]
MINILFVCMGNICRSPSAEGFFIRALQDSKIRGQVSTDSAGTHSYHVGHPPDSRAVSTALDFDVDISQLRARKVDASDFNRYDLIIAMDRSNFEDLQRIQPAGSKADLQMMMQYHPEARPDEVPDPYYGGMDGFTYMCKLLESATRGLLNDIEGRLAD